MVNLTSHSTDFIYGHIASNISVSKEPLRQREGTSQKTTDHGDKATVSLVAFYICRTKVL